MANVKWVLTCRECRAECTYSEIPEEDISAYFFPKKPDVPPGGFQFECTNCGHKDTYRRTDLTYRDDRRSPSTSIDACA